MSKQCYGYDENVYDLDYSITIKETALEKENRELKDTLKSLETTNIQLLNKNNELSNIIDMTKNYVDNNCEFMHTYISSTIMMMLEGKYHE